MKPSNDASGVVQQPDGQGGSQRGRADTVVEAPDEEPRSHAMAASSPPPVGETSGADVAAAAGDPQAFDPSNVAVKKPRLDKLPPLRPSSGQPLIAESTSADAVDAVPGGQTDTLVPHTAAPLMRPQAMTAPETVAREVPRTAEVPSMAEATRMAEPVPATQSMAMEAAPVEPASESPEDSSGSTRIKVFYATDRARVAEATALVDWRPFLPSLIVAGVAVVLMMFGRTSKRKALGWAAAVAFVGAAGLAVKPAIASLDRWTGQSQHRIAYGNERGRLEMGICEVSIPKDHRVGEIESPSVLRLEFRQDEEKHVVLHEVLQLDDADFFGQLRDCVQNAQRKEVFVFVHGYNVTFDNAARRTAQIAYDLKFAGAPIFYSWPSQGGLLKYTVDETNVAWTVPHLKRFLLDVARQSGADSVNLIAHSMGNRALTGALHELTLEMQQQARLFNQVILAAPDVDAEIFRRDLAPAMIRASSRVTLYASSNDQALIASKRVHGYPRAGDSGESLVILSGVDTIDVSTVDTSLLGHSYYGSSNSILADIYQLLHLSRPANERRFLRPMPRDGLTYWVFEPAERTARSPE